jgi:hypothetical protein
MISETETKARLADLSIGPSRQAARFARNILARNLWSTKAMSIVFLPHFGKSGRAFSGQRARFRESFDESLDRLELLELSIESGYLSPEAVRKQALAEMKVLLKSAASQSYLEHYDYLLVRFLAARFDFPLTLPRLVPPEPNPECELRFAAFLSAHNQWESDPNIEMFTMVLDDYRFGERLNSEFFSDYLQGRRRAKLDAEEEVRIRQLSIGLDHFVNLLGGLFGQLSETLQPYFGSFYAYWLAKFFGCELGERGYTEYWDSWESDVIKLYSSAFSPNDTSLEEARTRRAAQMKVMRETWSATRKLLGTAVRQAARARIRISSSEIPRTV